MNRLSPLIVRRTGRTASAAAVPVHYPRFPIDLPRPGGEDLRLFATNFLGGFVFFSVLLA